MYKLKQLPEDFIVEEIPLYKAKEKGRYCYFLLEKKQYNTVIDLKAYPFLQPFFGKILWGGT